MAAFRSNLKPPIGFDQCDEFADLHLASLPRQIGCCTTLLLQLLCDSTSSISTMISSGNAPKSFATRITSLSSGIAGNVAWVRHDVLRNPVLFKQFSIDLIYISRTMFSVMRSVPFGVFKRGRSRNTGCGILGAVPLMLDYRVCL